MRILLLLLTCLTGMTGLFVLPARAGDDDFTHYVLALSWNASWCAREGDARDADQCDPRHELGFTLHGLWPQGERDWPSYCRATARDPSRSRTAAMADIMGSAGLAWYQWKKHGRCSGLTADEYFKLARDAWEAIQRPEVLRRIDRTMRLPPDVVEQAFLEANPGLAANQLAVTCRHGYLQEVRICLTKGLVPRACTVKTERGCQIGQVIFPPMR